MSRSGQRGYNYDQYAGGQASYESSDQADQYGGTSVDGYVLDAQGRIIVGKVKTEDNEVEAVNVFISQWKIPRRAAEMDGPMVRPYADSFRLI